jgi:hypothetical protein
MQDFSSGNWKEPNKYDYEEKRELILINPYDFD